MAHILPAKDRNTNFSSWDRQEVERRYYLTLHPCNLFFVPGVRNRALGENPEIIQFVARQYAARYATTWKEFVARTGKADPGGLERALDHRVALQPSGVEMPAQRDIDGEEDGRGHAPGTNPSW